MVGQTYAGAERVDDAQAVFARFHRAAGTRSTPGSGLGLAIVHDLVTADGGEVFTASAPGGGAEVGFHLPPVPAGATTV
ncbi:ATP-binding protein [Kitasatospora sp. NPDC091207]|uniref:ATP-binding protein n=1 Tax=Kitasatospora sp. NPDC091207 TaxID=3364083 RepID=UPI0038138C23